MTAPSWSERTFQLSQRLVSNHKPQTYMEGCKRRTRRFKTRPPMKSSSLSSSNDRLKEEEPPSPPLRRLELLLKIRQTRNLEHWLIFDDRALLFGAYQFAPIKKQNKGSFVHTKDN